MHSHTELWNLADLSSAESRRFHEISTDSRHQQPLIIITARLININSEKAACSLFSPITKNHLLS